MFLDFHLIDRRFKHNIGAYAAQSACAAGVLLVILLVQEAVDRAAIVAAIASTGFVVFILPHSRMATPRNVLGGHIIALLIGSGAVAVGGSSTLALASEGAGAVGVSIFLMAVTDTEHAPAAGTALGVVTHGFSWSLVLLLAGSVAAMVAVHRIVRRWLKDLD